MGADPAVGRREELRFIRDNRARGARGVVIAGEAGVGKSRLAREALVDAGGEGWTTQWVGASETLARVPFGPFSPLFGARHRGGSDPLDRLRDGITRRNGGAVDRFALVLDDAHSLDPESAGLVHRLALTADFFLIVTVRTGEQMPRAVTELWKDGPLERLELQALPRPEAEELVHRLLGKNVDDVVLTRLWSLSRGNPLYLTELIRSARESGVLASSGGSWSWTGTFEPGTRLIDVIQSRLGRLDLEERGALEVLAVAEPLEVDFLERLASPLAMERLERRGLLTISCDEPRALVWLSHPVYGEALRPTVPRVRSRAVQRQLATLIEDHGARRRTDVVRIATWQLDAGIHANPTLLTSAARHAYSAVTQVIAERLRDAGRHTATPATERTGGPTPSGRNGLDDAAKAIRLARAAVAAGGGLTAEFALIEILIWHGAFAEAEEALGGMSDRYPEESDQAVLAEAKAALLFWGKGKPEQASEVLRVGEERTNDQRLKDRLRRSRAGIELQSGDPRTGFALARATCERRDAPDASVAAGGATAAGALALMGRGGEACELVDRTLPAALRSSVDETPLVVGELMIGRFWALRSMGRLEEAANLAQMAHDLSAAEGLVDGTGLFGGALGLVALDQGRVDAAVRLLQTADTLMRDRDGTGVRAWLLANLATAQALRGDASGGRASFDAATEAKIMKRFFDADLAIADAWLAWTQGEPERGAHLAAQAGEIAASHGLLSFAISAWHVAARLGMAAEAADVLARLSSEVDGHLAQVLAAHAAARAAGDGIALSRASRSFEDLGMLLLAAEATADASRVFRRKEEPAAAAAAHARAVQLAARCERARTPSLLALGGHAALTDRELDIARLAAGGRSSQAIADDLSISVRTVENHLYRAYSKLGLTNRGELRRALGSAEPQG